MASRKTKKKNAKSPHKRTSIEPANDATPAHSGDMTEDESIHEKEDVHMADADESDENIPDVVEQDLEDSKESAEKSTTDEAKDTAKTKHQPMPFMDTFYQLSSDESPRLRAIAARDLISHCFFSNEEGQINTTDAAYALTRLMNGLCTGRAASRQGFASCLSSFLRVAYEKSKYGSARSGDALMKILEQDAYCKQLIEAGENNSEPATVLRQKLLTSTQFLHTEKEAKKNGGKMKGMEERDHAFGRLFGILAVVRSGIFSLKDFPFLTIDGYTNDLIQLYNYKKWLREPAANAIIELVSSLDSGALSRITNDTIVPRLFLSTDDKIDVQDRELWIRGLNPEQIALALHLQRSQKNLGYACPLDKAILTAETVPLLAQALTSTSCVVYPRCHIVWNSIWLYLTEESEGYRRIRKVEESHGDYTGVIEQLINQVVIESLIGKNETTGSPSHERRSLALQIVSALGGASSLRIVLPPELISTLFSPVVVECVFLKVMSASGGIGMKRATTAEGDSEGKYVEHRLKSLATTTLADMVACCCDDDSISRRMAIVNALVSADPRFDTRTKTQTVSSLLMFNVSGKELTDDQERLQKALWERYLSFLEEAIISADSLHKATLYVELMCKLAKRDLLSAPANDARRVIRFFMTAAFFDCSEISVPTSKHTQSAKKKKTKKSPGNTSENEHVPQELESAIRIKELLRSYKLESIPQSSRAIMSARFYSLLSDFVSAINAPSRGGSKPNSFYGKSSKPEAVYRALSEICGVSSVLEICGAKRFTTCSEGNSSEDEPPVELSRKHMLNVKKIADEALVKECAGSVEVEHLRAQSVFATGCASLMISLYLQVYSCGDVDNLEEEDDSEDNEAVHEFISDLSEIVENFFRVLENQATSDDDNDENPLAALVALLVNILSSSIGGEDPRLNNASMASASKLTREAVKMAWSGVISLISSLSVNGSIHARRNFVDEDVMNTVIESVCGASEGNDVEGGQESTSESGDDEDDSQVFAQATNMDLDLDEHELESAKRRVDHEGESGLDEDVELDPSKLENMLLEDSDAEIDVLEHHAGADKALAQLIKMKQETRKASQAERERIDFCNRLRCASLLDALFSASVLKSGWLPQEAVLGSFIPMLRSYKMIAKNIEKSLLSPLAMKSINEKKSLLDRLASLIQEKLSKFRCSDNSVADKNSMLKAAVDISDEMKHSLSLAHCSCCSVALIAVVRSIPDVENETEVAKMYANCLQDWSSRKSSKIHTCVFDDLIQRIPSLATVVLVQPLITAAKDAHTGFLRCESLRLLSLLFRGDKNSREETLSMKAQTVLNNSCNSFAITLKDSLCDSALEKSRNKEEILNAVKHFVVYAKSHAAAMKKSSIDDLQKALLTAADSTNSAGIRSTCSRMADELTEVAQHADKDSDTKPSKTSSKKKKKSKK